MTRRPQSHPGPDLQVVVPKFASHPTAAPLPRTWSGVRLAVRVWRKQTNGKGSVMTQFEDKLKKEAGSEAEKGEQELNQKVGIDDDQTGRNPQPGSAQTDQQQPAQQ
jgi:hypothetical protein